LLMWTPCPNVDLLKLSELFSVVHGDGILSVLVGLERFQAQKLDQRDLGNSWLTGFVLF
jgi:hypothetical protein